MVLFHITLFILMFAIILEIFYLFSFPQLEQLSGVEIDSKIELLIEVPGAPIGALFFKLKLKPIGRNIVDSTISCVPELRKLSRSSRNINCNVLFQNFL